MPKVTERHMLATRARVLGAAEALFARKGYYDTSMNEIVERSGLSKGAIYGHFRSKEELFVALQDIRVEATLKGLKSTFGPEDSAQDKLEKAADLVFGSLIGSSRNDCRIGLEFEVAAPRIKSLQQRRDVRFKATLDFVREIIEEGIQKGEFRRDADPGATALLLASVADGLALEWATTTLEFDWKSLKSQTKRIVFEGLLSHGPGKHQ